MTKRKIALISDCASPIAHQSETGNEQSVYVLETAKHLAALGYEIDIFTRRCSPEQPEIVQWLKNVRVIHVPAGPPSELEPEFLLRLMPQFTSYMIRFLKQKSYDLIHANSYLAGLVALNLKRTNETPFVVTFHDLGRVECPETSNNEDVTRARCEIEDRIVRNADRIVAKTIQEKTDLMYLYDGMPEKISVVERGIDLLGAEMSEEASPEPHITWQTIAENLAAIYAEVILANEPAAALRAALRKYTGKLSAPNETQTIAVPIETLTDNQNPVSLSP